MNRIPGHMSWQQPNFVRFFCVFTLFALNSNNRFLLLLVILSNVLLGAMKNGKGLSISSQFADDLGVSCLCLFSG